MTMKRNPNPKDADRIAELDDARLAYFFRDPDRPDSKFSRNVRAGVSSEVKRAQARLRNARYRADLDRRKAPTVRDFGMALAVALATTTDWSKLSPADFDLIRRALLELQSRGFDMMEARATMRRLRKRSVGAVYDGEALPF